MRKKIANTLIITSSVNPVLTAPEVEITDPETRLFQLCCSVVSWSQVEGIEKMILCDNSAPNYNFQALTDMVSQAGKTLEILTFLGDRKQVAMRGKGFGEGEIIKHVFENSRLIKKCDSFYKITGRVFISNFNEIHKTHLRVKKVFENPVPSYGRKIKKIFVYLFHKSRHKRGTVQTIFYKCDILFIKKNSCKDMSW